MGSPWPPAVLMDPNHDPTLPHPPNIISGPTSHNLQNVPPITESRVTSDGNSKSPGIHDYLSSLLASKERFNIINIYDLT